MNEPLATFAIDAVETFNESRRKILRLAQALGFDAVEAGRLASIFSEITRPARDGRGARAELALTQTGRGPALAIRFAHAFEFRGQQLAARFFDSFAVIKPETSPPGFAALKYLPDPEFVATTAVLDSLREMLAKPSREELLLALKRKNDDLEREVIERRLTEEALRRSEGRIQAVLEGTPDALIMVDGAGLITFANSQAEATFGYAREELLGQPVEMLVPAERRADHPGKTASFFAGGRTREMGLAANLYAVARDGRRIAVDLKLSLLPTESGPQAIVSIRDVTAQKKALESIKQLSLVMEQSPASVVITDVRGVIEYVNPAFTVATGYAPQEVLGRTPRILKSGRTPPETYADLWGAVTAGRIWRGMLVNRRKNGEDFYERTAIAPIFNLENVVTHYAAVKEDVTEQIRNEEELKRQRTLLDTLINALPLVIYAKDAKGAYQIANDSLCALVGRPREEVVGKTAHDLFPKETADGIHAADQRTLPADGPLYEEDWRAYPDGRRAIFHMTRMPLRNDAGQAVGLVGAFLDVTESKKAQDALHDAMDVISGSIRYASRIQRAVLPKAEEFSKVFSKHFIVWNPRDVVGGDIYWSAKWGEGQLFALGDCTGHGVPGAFMTLISTGALSRALNEVAPGRPGLLMRRAHQIVQTSLNQHVAGGESDDGMELGLCYVEPAARRMLFVGARFPLFVVADGEISELKADKKGIGYRAIAADQNYEEHEIALSPGLRLYLVSDGVFDQVGGERKRGFGKKRFRELLLSLADTPFERHGQAILDALGVFQGEESRRDDVSIMGLEL